MAAAAIVSYPQSFLYRPEDRLFMASLVHLGVDSDTAELMLYRVWRDFGSGGSDRRALTKGESMALDPQVRLLAQSAGFKGDPGQFIQHGIAAGFFVLEGVESRAPVLVCKDFFPINSSWSVSGKSIQKKGAYARVANRQAKEAEESAARHLELLRRTGSPPDFPEQDPERRRAAIIFMHRLSRALGFPLPPDEKIRQDGLLVAADAVVVGTEVKRLDDTLVWLLSRAKDPAINIPRNLKELLAAWPSLVEQAAREMM